MLEQHNGVRRLSQSRARTHAYTCSLHYSRCDTQPPQHCTHGHRYTASMCHTPLAYRHDTARGTSRDTVSSLQCGCGARRPPITVPYCGKHPDWHAYIALQYRAVRSAAQVPQLPPAVAFPQEASQQHPCNPQYPILTAPIAPHSQQPRMTVRTAPISELQPVPYSTPQSEGVLLCNTHTPY